MWTQKPPGTSSLQRDTFSQSIRNFAGNLGFMTGRWMQDLHHQHPTPAPCLHHHCHHHHHHHHHRHRRHHHQHPPYPTGTSANLKSSSSSSKEMYWLMWDPQIWQKMWVVNEAIQGIVDVMNRARRQSGFPTFISCQHQDANVLPKRRQWHQGDKICDVSTVPLVARWPVFLARGSDADGEPHCDLWFL